MQVDTTRPGVISVLPDIALPPEPPSADPEVEVDPHLDPKTVSTAFRLRTYEALEQFQAADAGGTALTQWYTRQIDRLIVYLFTAAERLYARRYPKLQQRCVLFAQGGYGRKELNPYSDLDLLLLYQKLTPYVETVSETVVGSLLDARFDVAAAGRNIRECVQWAQKNLTVKSALLDTRYLCGDKPLDAEFTLALEHEIIGKQPERFFQDQARASEERYQRYGGSIYMLEPELKEGQGGLRDLHTAGWLARVKFKAQDVRELLAKSVISEQTLGAVETARDFLWQVRNSVHLLERDKQDHLTFERQDHLAPALGFADVTDFMRHYYGHATTLHEFSRLMFERCRRPPPVRFFVGLFGRPQSRTIRPGVVIANETLKVTDATRLTAEPVTIVILFHDAQRHHVCLDDGTRQLIRDAVAQLPPTAAATPQVRDAFFAVLNSGVRVASTLYDMHALGVLDWLLPEFGRQHWRTQRDMYHIYTVDEHTLHGVAELERLRDGDYKTELPLLTQVMREISKPEVLFLSMLFHDVGKGYGHEHSERGAQMVHAAATRWQMPPDDAHEWHTLVRYHLLMSHLAQHRDLADDTVITNFARLVGTRDVLKKLYVLTFADMKAVSPKIWNAWKGDLLAQLYVRTLEQLETDEVAEEGREARLQRRKTSLRQTLTAVAAPPQVETFLDAMPDSYFLSTPEEAIPGHLQLVTRFQQRQDDGDNEPYRATLVHFPAREFSELTVVTTDRPGLFATLTGVLSVYRMNIAGARISTSQDKIALDVFQLSHLNERGPLTTDPEVWKRVYQRLGEALRGERTMEDLLLAAQSTIVDPRHARIPTDVNIDNTLSPDYTVIDITAPDRPGLLFTITYTLFQLGVEIHLAKINTNVAQVLDVFYVTEKDTKEKNPDGLAKDAKVKDPDGLASALRRQLMPANPL